MNKINKIWLLAFLIFFISACDTEDELIEDRINSLPSGAAPTAGTADFTKFVAVGNSTSAGFMDAALYNLGQSNSFPNLLSGQFALVGGGAFNQPDINSENGFNTLLQLSETPFTDGRFLLDVSIPGPVPTIGEDIGAFTGDKSALNNFAVPGARVVDLASPAVVANPFYQRMASNPGTSTILGDATAANGTFFTFWIGSNDVLGWAVSGGTGADAETGGSLADPSTLTDIASFTAAYGAALNAMTANGADGVVINIPPILTLPFFQAVPWNSIVFEDTPEDQATITALNTAFAGFNAFVTAAGEPERAITYSVGANPILIVDETATDFSGTVGSALGQARPATENDIILFTSATVLGTTVGGDPTLVNGVSVPMGDQFILIPSEQVQLETRRQTFNGIISNVVTNHTGTGNVVLIDTTPTFEDLVGLDGSALGLVVNGVNYLPDFSPNGIYSTDGVHPNPRGQAILANVVIEAINTNFNATIPLLDVSAFPSVQLAQ